MTDIASLGIKVTTDGVTQAADQLDKLEKSGQRAAASQDNLNKSFSQAASGGASKTISDAYKTQRDELSKLVGQIDPAVAALDKLDKQQAKLTSFKKSGAISADDFNVYSTAIDKARGKITTASDAVHTFSLNNSIARRELGLMTKDLATGQYGRLSQSALTLASNTGIMGLAFTAAGASVLGLVGGIAALGAAYFKGQGEAEAFNKALIVTGNYSGQTADSLADTAKALSGYGTTQHEAAATLAEVAASGKFTASQIQLVGQAAVDMSKLTGQSIQDTIKQFGQLQDEPLKAVTALDSAQHFLTTAIYEQIKALEDQGRAQDAADLAMRTYAQTVGDRTNQVTQNLGLIEQSWNGIKNAAKAAADAALNFGRAQTGQEQFDDIAKKRDALLEIQKQGAQLVEDASGKAVPIQGQIDAYTAQLSAMQDARIAAQKDANKKSLASQATLALEQSDAEAALYASREEKRTQEVLAAHNKANLAIEKALAAGDTSSAERIRANEAKIVAGINAKYAEKRPRAAKADPMASLNGLTDRAITQNSIGSAGDPQAALLKEQVNQLQAIAKAAGEAIQKGASLAEVQAKVSTATQAVNEHFKAESDQLTKKNIAANNAYQQSLDDQLQTRKDQIALQVQSIGLGAKEAQQRAELLRIDQAYNREVEKLNRQHNSLVGGLDDASYKERLADAKKFHDDNIAITKDGFLQEATGQANALSGMKSAIADFMDSQRDLAAQTKQFTTDFIQGFGDAFASFASGAESAKKAFGGFLDSMYQQALKFLANQAIKKLFESLGNTGTGSTGADASGSVWAGLFSSVVSAFSKSAKGNVFESPSLSQYSGQIVTQPTTFAFAHGAGLMGEAGPEAIMPLKRTPGGRLGVEVSGGTPGRNVSVNQTIVVQGTINRRTASQIAQQTAQKQRIATTRNS